MKWLHKTISFVLIFCTLACLCITAGAANVDTRIGVAAGGMAHTIALMDDGTVKTWGSNGQMQLGTAKYRDDVDGTQIVDGLTDVVSVAAGHYFSLALRADGTVYAWGGAGGRNEKPLAVYGLSNIVAIAAGQNTALAVNKSGQVWQWTYGEAPKAVPGLSNVAAISCGGGHNLAVTNAGDIYAWGENNNAGQLGNGTTNRSATPVKVPGLFNVIDVAAGTNHSLAVTFDGTVYAWGANNAGQLGDGTNDQRTKPVRVTGLQNIVQVSAGRDSSVALSKDGSIYTWGYGEYGQLGDGTSVISRNLARKMPITGKATYIASGGEHNIYAGVNGSLYLWGRNKDGQVGGAQNANIMTPKMVINAAKKTQNYQTNLFAGVSDWARGEIETLYKKEMVSPILWGGYTTNITRAGLAHLLISVYEQIKGPSTATQGANMFADIQNNIFKDDICKAYSLGIISGKSKTVFAPSEPVTREAAAKMLCVFVSRMKSHTISTNPVSLPFYNDSYLVSSWATPYVAYAYNQSIMMGSNGKFNPQGNLTREQALLTMARLIEKNNWKAR